MLLHWHFLNSIEIIQGNYNIHHIKHFGYFQKLINE